MKSQFISDFEDKTNVDCDLLVRGKTLGVGKNGRLFMSLELGDRSGYLDARVWDKVEDMSSQFEIGDIVHIRGQVQLYQSRKQIIIHKLERKDSTNMDRSDFVAISTKDPVMMFTELAQIVQGVQNSQIKQLIMSTLEDPEIKDMFMRAPAAKTIHHAWESGLLEHVLSMAQIMVSLAGHYKFLNGDFLIFGAIFHDLGKIYELSYEKNISYSYKGRLLGHMQLACELIDRKASTILGFSDELKTLLKHIVLSHHGKLEYGSPKRPKFIEAMIVAMVDEMDSRVNSLQSIMEGERVSGDRWSKYNEMYDRYFLIENLKESYR